MRRQSAVQKQKQKQKPGDNERACGSPILDREERVAIGIHAPNSLSALPSGERALTRERVAELLQRIAALKVGVVGDGCLDLYWHADMRLSELSRETPHHNLPIIREERAPGAAGNVAVNFSKLNCAEVAICSVFGDDWRGMLLREQLRAHRIDDSYCLEEADRYTPTYCKTIRHGLQGVRQEDKRLDFVNRTPPSPATSKRLLEQLDRLAARVDAISVVDQVDHGVISAELLRRLQYWAERGKLIVADSRSRIGWFRGLIVKPNEVEAVRSVRGGDRHDRMDSESELIEAGLRLSGLVGRPCCVTLGDKGALWVEDGQCAFVPTAAVAPPVDITGAGDTFHAALIAALGAGASGPEAVAFSHLAAAVSVRRLDGAGSASPQDILDRYDEIA